MNTTIICNPSAGKRNGHNGLKAAINVFEQAGWNVELAETSGPGDATRLARKAAGQGHDSVLVAGGDGTMNEVVQALAGTETALGYVPFGTVNVWAREIHLPLAPEKAARVLVEGRIESVDLGVANDRRFLLMASLGFDSEVIRRARSLESLKPRFGILPYVATGLATVPTYRGSDLELRYDGVIRKIQALMIVIGNTRLYGGRYRLTPDAVLNDGWLDLCIVKGRGPLALARRSLPMLLSGSIRHSDVELLRVKQLQIQSGDPMLLQVDGELSGATPATFRVEPRSLKVIIPSGFVSELIA
jgi:diacylglycerol kinase (ATP)